MAERNKKLNLFAQQLEDNFKGIISGFRNLKGSNIVTYLLFSLAGGGFALLLTYVYVKSLVLLNHISSAEPIGEILEQYTLSFIPYMDDIIILNIALFAIMIKGVDLGENLNLLELFRKIKPKQWQAYFVYLSLLFVINVVLEYSDPWSRITIDHEYLYNSRPSEIRVWTRKFLSSVVNLVPYYFAAVMVNSGERNINYHTKENAPQVFAGMIMILVVTIISFRFTTHVSLEFAKFYEAITSSGNDRFSIQFIIMGVAATLTLAAKARAFHYRPKVEKTTILEDKIPDTDILDDID